MRSDYALYGLAIVLFAITAITLVYVGTSDGLLYATATAIVGIVSIGGGYFLRPKASPTPAPQTATPEPNATTPPQPTTTEPVPQTGGPIVEAPTTQIQTVENQKTETLAVEAPPVVTPAASETQPPIIAEAPPVEAPPIIVAAPAQPVEESTSAAPSAAKGEFAQIRSISEKRAEQLKALGINTLADLANASASDLAEKLNVSPKIVKMWIGIAKKSLK